MLAGFPAPLRIQVMQQSANHGTEQPYRFDGRQSAFGYTCNACSQCCYHKKIQVNPFEAASLAAHLGIETTVFLREYTMAGEGIYLAQGESGGCIFLGEQGCAVHSSRPLVCRLYPLGRTRHADGSEEWETLASHPESAGQFDRAGTIADFLAGQHAQELIRIADAYVDWVNRAQAKLAVWHASGDSVTGLDASLFNLDDSVAEYCATAGIPVPQSLEQRCRLHIHILDQALEKLEGDHR